MKIIALTARKALGSLKHCALDMDSKHGYTEAHWTIFHSSIKYFVIDTKLLHTSFNLNISKMNFSSSKKLLF